MICPETSLDRVGAPVANRPVLARQRAQLARALLRRCTLCAHQCEANRLAGQRGPCRAGVTTRFFSAQIEAGEERELVPSYNIALSGCDMRCAFCITGESSWNPLAGSDFEPVRAAIHAAQALHRGAKCVLLLGGEPTVHLPAALEFAAAMPPEALLVWKTNGHGSQDARDLLDRIFDVWVVDLKFGNDLCAQRLSGINGYSEAVRMNLAWAASHTRLIVRHLLMPGHLDCCWKPVAQWLATELPGVKVSLRTGFWPTTRSSRHPELTTGVTEDQAKHAILWGERLGLNLIA